MNTRVPPKFTVSAMQGSTRCTLECFIFQSEMSLCMLNARSPQCKGLIAFATFEESIFILQNLIRQLRTLPSLNVILYGFLVTEAPAAMFAPKHTHNLLFVSRQMAPEGVVGIAHLGTQVTLPGPVGLF